LNYAKAVRGCKEGVMFGNSSLDATEEDGVVDFAIRFLVTPSLEDKVVSVAILFDEKVES